MGLLLWVVNIHINNYHEKLGHSSIGTQYDFGIPHSKKPP